MKFKDVQRLIAKGVELYGYVTVECEHVSGYDVFTHVIGVQKVDHRFAEFLYRGKDGELQKTYLFPFNRVRHITRPGSNAEYIT